ncbi:hypothetical protein GCM10009533_02470 [Saccharopolyspora spinosporotrichia]|uniref:Uncharacterized protein n=1 Tax=Saccharopolyspora erythraea TaxID=1836 RepID=A0ABP3LV81_SACER
MRVPLGGVDGTRIGVSAIAAGTLRFPSGARVGCLVRAGRNGANYQCLTPDQARPGIAWGGIDGRDTEPGLWA